MSNRLTTLLVFLFCMAFAGCASLKEKDTSVINLTYQQGKTSDDSWQDAELKKEFERYWFSRFSGLWESTWLMEAPHFQEMTVEKKYEDFIKAHVGSRLLGIEIWNIEKETNNLTTIRCEISYEKNGESKKYFNTDKWVKVSGKWYHLIQDRILFPSSM